MGLPHDEGWAIPFDAPFYPPLPAWYRNVRFQQVFFRADPAAVARFLPEPLEPAPDGECVAIGIQIPFSTAYGPINEAVLELKATFRGKTGWYSTYVWHDGPSGIAAGREIYGTPKVFSKVDIEYGDGTMLTRAHVGGIPVITISTTGRVPIDGSALRGRAPAWRLKLIPRADGPGPAIKQLVDAANATLDLEMHWAYAGRGTVSFEPSPLGDVSGLRPLEYGEAHLFEASYGEGYATIAYDYLEGR